METRMVRAKEVMKTCGLSRSTLWRKERDGTFPRSRRLSGRAVGWLVTEIQEWMETRPYVQV